MTGQVFSLNLTFLPSNVNIWPCVLFSKDALHVNLFILLKMVQQITAGFVY